MYKWWRKGGSEHWEALASAPVREQLEIGQHHFLELDTEQLTGRKGSLYIELDAHLGEAHAEMLFRVLCTDDNIACSAGNTKAERREPWRRTMDVVVVQRRLEAGDHMHAVLFLLVMLGRFELLELLPCVLCENVSTASAAAVAEIERDRPHLLRLVRRVGTRDGRLVARNDMA